MIGRGSLTSRPERALEVALRAQAVDEARWASEAASSARSMTAEGLAAPAAGGRSVADWGLDGTVGGRLIDLYVPAGPVTPEGHQCHTEQEGSCELYRVRWDLDAERAVEVESVMGFERRRPPEACNGGRGMVQPAVSPDGTRLVWLERCWDTDGAGQPAQAFTRMMVTDLVGGDTQVMAEGDRPEDRPQHPTWENDERILYQKAEEIPAGSGGLLSTLYRKRLDNPGEEQALAGPRWQEAAGVPESEFHSVQDVMVHRTPADRPPGPVRLASFGGLAGVKRPYLSNIHGEDRTELDLRAPDVPFTECHHPAWHPDGDQVLCTRQEQPELPWGTDKAAARLLYAFAHSMAGWGLPERLFDPPSPAELDDLFAGDILSTTNASMYTYKFAEWTPDGRHVICTLYSSETIQNPDGLVLDSRVVLIRVRGEFRMWDITAEVERAAESVLSAPPRRWQGVFGTAAPVRGGA